jgi:hypothetical protein
MSILSARMGSWMIFQNSLETTVLIVDEVVPLRFKRTFQFFRGSFKQHLNFS